MKKILTLITLLLFSITTAFAYECSQVRAEHILVKNKTHAEAIKARIDEGESFEYYAKLYSLCPSGKKGGDLGYFGRGQMVPEFENAAFKMAIGEVSEPIETPFGWHIIKILDKR